MGQLNQINWAETIDDLRADGIAVDWLPSQFTGPCARALRILEAKAGIGPLTPRQRGRLKALGFRYDQGARAWRCLPGDTPPPARRRLTGDAPSTETYETYVLVCKDIRAPHGISAVEYASAAEAEAAGQRGLADRNWSVMRLGEFRREYPGTPWRSIADRD